MQKLITLAESEDLIGLYSSLPAAQARVLSAMKTYPPSHILSEESHALWISAEESEAAIITRIKEILGLAPSPWTLVL
jgi:hypothetical protein